MSLALASQKRDFPPQLKVSNRLVIAEAYRCSVYGVIPRHAKHIMTPPMTRMAPPIQPTKRAGPNVYLQESKESSDRYHKTLRNNTPNVDTILMQLHLGAIDPIIPAAPPPNPSSMYVVNRKLRTIKLAKADTPAMPHTPEN